MIYYTIAQEEIQDSEVIQDETSSRAVRYTNPPPPKRQAPNPKTSIRLRLSQTPSHARLLSLFPALLFWFLCRTATIRKPKRGHAFGTIPIRRKRGFDFDAFEVKLFAAKSRAKGLEEDVISETPSDDGGITKGTKVSGKGRSTRTAPSLRGLTHSNRQSSLSHPIISP
jgi:hypothetical protein